MKITTSGQGLDKTQTITITLEPGDDEIGLLNGLVLRGRLESWLRAYGRPSDLGAPAGEDDRHLLVVRFGAVANMTESRWNDLLWAARDTWGWSWRRLAAAAELPVTTTRRRVVEARQGGAEAGWWRDRDGAHHGPIADALARLSHVDEAD